MTDAGLTIAEVRSGSEERAFRSLPYALYARDPCWVAPLRREERRRWSPAHNPSLAGRSVQRWLARRGGRVVGRLAAIVDPGFQRWEPDAGCFGFFECEDDAAAAAALLEAAARWLARQGLARMVGPVNLTTNDEVGLLVDGFDSPPMLLSPYNPPYYATLLAAAGCTPLKDYHAYAWEAAAPLSPVARRALRRLAAAGGVRVRASAPGRWDQDTRTLFALYAAAFADVWGFVPLNWEEFRQRADAFRPIHRPELVAFAEAEGEPVGFALALPDVNAALRGLDGRLLPFGWLRLLARVRRLDTARLLLLGVLPAYAGRGIAALLVRQVIEGGRRLGVRRAELSLVQADNRRMRHVIEAFGGTLAKTYRLYDRPTAGGEAA